MTTIHRSPILVCVNLAVLFLAISGHTVADETLERRANAELARGGVTVLRQYCSKCHGPDVDSSGSNLDVTNVASLVESGFLDLKNPDDSPLWQRMLAGEMPPLGEPQPSVAEGAILRKWIGAGAPTPERSERKHVTNNDILAAILADLQSLTPGQRADRRYFTLANIANHPQIDDAELRLHAAALSKALNSLSRSDELVIPTAIEATGTVFAINIRKLGWTDEMWQAICAAYPYGLHHRQVRNEQQRQLALQISELVSEPHRDSLIALRADWFIVTATRPPLYHLLLDIPATLTELEQRIGVNAHQNFIDNKLMRAGFAESGVSVANRAVEWHAADWGYYWKSFDFLEDRTEGNLFQRPLGPKSDRNPFNDFAFTHDGGEMFFSLPNGLQGYMLTDAAGNRINEGPVTVVQDAARTAGGPIVVNGISCMNCHAHGTIPFRDTVRNGLGLFGNARLKVLSLFPAQERLDQQLQASSVQFMTALTTVLEPFLIDESEAGRSIADFPEPIGVVARRYHANVGLAEATVELGIADPQQLSTTIVASPVLKSLGLGPLSEGRSVDRSFWQSRRDIVSPMQLFARELDLGTPVNVLPPE